MSAEIPTREQYLPAIWADDALTTIPTPPVANTSYRNADLDYDTLASGWPYQKIVDSADFNQTMWLLTNLMQQIEQYGLLPWCAETEYKHGGVCLGSDAVFYYATQDNTGNNPTTDTNHTYWDVLFDTNDSFVTESELMAQVDLCEKIANKTTSITSSSTATQYPAASAVYSLYNDLSTQINTVQSNLSTVQTELESDISELQSDVATIQGNYVTTNTLQTISATKYFSGGIVVGTSLTSGVRIYNAGALELYPTSGYNPYIDFHYNGSTTDYTSRIIENAEGILTATGGLNINGSLSVYSSTALTGALSVSGQTTHSGTTIFNNTITTNGTANLASTVNITGTTSHSGTTTFNNTVNCNSNTYLSGTNTVAGATTFSNSSVLRSSSLSASDSSTQIPTTAWVNSRISSIMDSDGGAMLNPDYSSITSIETGYVAPSSGIVYLTQSLGNVTTSVAVNDTTVLTMKGHSGSSHGQPQPCATVILGSGDTVTFANTSSSYFVPFG